jgi:AcrR family transcriptional regulator
MAKQTPPRARERLTRDRILAKAVEMLDAEGTAALSMRRLSAELGIEAMSLYHHFPNKQAILGGVVETIMAEALAASPPPSGGGDWRAQMREGIGVVRRAMLAHPNAGPLLLGGEYRASETVVWVEAPLRILRDAGFTGRELVAAYHAISAYSFGWHLIAADAGRGVWHDVRTPDGELPAEALEVTREVGPLLGDWTFGFEDGLDMLLDGLEQQRIDRARGQGTGR